MIILYYIPLGRTLYKFYSSFNSLSYQKCEKLQTVCTKLLLEPPIYLYNGINYRSEIYYDIDIFAHITK